jgi:hypothetical protein
MPLLALSIKADARVLQRKLDDLGRKQIPFGASQTMNRLARQVVDVDLPKKMDAVFDRPTPWVKRGFAWKKSTARSLTATIFARDFAGKGNPAWKSLGPEVFGGTRKMKRFERALLATLGEGGFAALGSGARLNQYGNISQGTIEQILSAVGAAEQHAGFTANRTQRSSKRRKQETFFLAHSDRNGKALGIWKVVGSGKVAPILVFSAKSPRYSKRLPYLETAQASFDANRVKFLDEEMAKAIATAK